MRAHSDKTKVIGRIIDANMNRAKEGLRVCEEVTRFILNSRGLTLEFKKIRHAIDSIYKNLAPQALVAHRSSLSDVGRGIHVSELKRTGYQDIFFANIQRVKESIRVLEEFSKLKDTGTAVKFKKIRYSVYELEKKVTGRIPPLRHPR